MTWAEARVYCREGCRVGDYEDWRLPSYAELGSLIVPEKLVDDPAADTFPFLEPFDEEIFGFLFTGTVLAENEPWVMNRRNGHMFNGARKRAVVRCVREVRRDIGLKLVPWAKIETHPSRLGDEGERNSMHRRVRGAAGRIGGEKPSAVSHR
jgi:hypothetical protein